jgi:murein DD-endopeptidase MepM/ murein hydrolase activator NlpD
VIKHYIQHLENIRVGDLLQQQGYIDATQLQMALAEQKKTTKRLGEILVEQGAVSAVVLRSVLLQQKLLKFAATIVLTTGTLASSAPQLFAPIFHSLPSGGGDTTAMGVGSGSKKTARGSVTEDGGQPDFMRVSLLDNPKPTMEEPLIGFCHPMAGKGFLSQGNNGITHRGRMAYAYDLAAPIGTPVYAMRAGRVVDLQDKYPDTGGGRENFTRFNYVRIEHDGGYRSAYLHLQQNFVAKTNLKKGDRVEAGQLIGYSGNSGWSTGPHLHLEVQDDGPTYRFNKTVPFAVLGNCQPSTIARSNG